MIAEFDENGLVNAAMSRVRDDGLSCIIDTNGGEIKAFLWEADSLKPLYGVLNLNQMSEG